MLIDLKRILNDSANKYEENDFLEAANRIRTNQFVWSDKHGDSKVFKIARKHKEYFVQLFSAFGDQFFIDDHFSYCGILPRLNQNKIKKIDTIFLLILARMHDSQIRKGAVEYGRSHPPAEILLDEYATLLPSSVKPKETEAKEALQRLKKFGVIELGAIQEHNRMPIITILPSIMRVVSKDYVEALNDFKEDPTLDLEDELKTNNRESAISDQENLND